MNGRVEKGASYQCCVHCSEYDPAGHGAPCIYDECPGAGEAVDWESRAVIAEAQVAAIRDMWGESRWLEFSMCALYQIRDRVLGELDSWERAK